MIKIELGTCDRTLDLQSIYHVYAWYMLAWLSQWFTRYSHYGFIHMFIQNWPSNWNIVKVMLNINIIYNT